MKTKIGILPHEVLFIINPNSGKGRATRLIDELAALQLSYIVTESKAAAALVFEDWDKTKYRGVVLVGGDGTINDAIQYLVNMPDIVLGVVPFGSGNGFSRELGFDTDLNKLMANFAKGETHGMDVLEINGNYAINVSGIGIDSYVAYHFQKSKRRGILTYIFSTFRAIRQFKDFKARIITSRKTYAGKYRMISIANTRQFGNNAIIAPTASPKDGRYVLVLVKPFPFWNYPIFFLKMFKGQLKNSKFIQFVTLSSNSRIEWDGARYHLDGEPKKSPDDLIIKLNPKMINIIKTEKS